MQNLLRVEFDRLVYPIVHPFPLSTADDEVCALQIGKVPRDLGIVGLEGVGQKADAHFTVSH